MDEDTSGNPIVFFVVAAVVVALMLGLAWTAFSGQEANEGSSSTDISSNEGETSVRDELRQQAIDSCTTELVEGALTDMNELRYNRPTPFSEHLLFEYGRDSALFAAYIDIVTGVSVRFSSGGREAAAGPAEEIARPACTVFMDGG